MPSTATPGDLEATIRHMGRGMCYYMVGAFAGTGTDLTLVFLGDTEGDIVVELNPEFAHLTTPELSGPVPRSSYLEGIAPVITIPLLAGDPALGLIVNPTGVASGSQGGGFDVHQAVTEYALVIFPHEVFVEDNVRVAVGYTTAGDWTVGGDAADAGQLALLDKSIFFWRGYFDPLVPSYKHGDGGKEIQEVTFNAMHNNAMQVGHNIYTAGRPDQAAVPIEISVA